MSLCRHFQDPDPTRPKIVNSFDEDADIDDIREAYEKFVEALIAGFYAFMFQGHIDVLSVDDSEDESSSVEDFNSDIFTVTTEISDGNCHDDTCDDFIDTGDENDDVDTE